MALKRFCKIKNVRKNLGKGATAAVVQISDREVLSKYNVSSIILCQFKIVDLNYILNYTFFVGFRLLIIRNRDISIMTKKDKRVSSVPLCGWREMEQVWKDGSG